MADTTTKESKTDMTLALIATGFGLLEKLIPWVFGLIEKAKQDKELTSEQADAYKSRFMNLFLKPSWQVETDEPTPPENG